MGLISRKIFKTVLKKTLTFPGHPGNYWGAEKTLPEVLLAF